MVDTPNNFLSPSSSTSTPLREVALDKPTTSFSIAASPPSGLFPHLVVLSTSVFSIYPSSIRLLMHSNFLLCFREPSGPFSFCFLRSVSLQLFCRSFAYPLMKISDTLCSELQPSLLLTTVQSTFHSHLPL